MEYLGLSYLGAGLGAGLVVIGAAMGIGRLAFGRYRRDGPSA